MHRHGFYFHLTTMNGIRSHRMLTGRSGAAAAVALSCGALWEDVLGASVQTKHLKWLHFPLLSKVCQCCTLNRASSVTFNQQTSGQFFPCVRHTSHCNTALWGGHLTSISAWQHAGAWWQAWCTGLEEESSDERLWHQAPSSSYRLITAGVFNKVCNLYIYIPMFSSANTSPLQLKGWAFSSFQFLVYNIHILSDFYSNNRIWNRKICS